MQHSDDILLPLNKAAETILNETASVPNAENVRKRLLEILGALPAETRASSIFAIIANHVGIDASRTTPAEARIEELTAWVVAEARELLNPVVLKPKTIAIPDSIDSGETTLTLNGREIKLPVTYYDTNSLALSIVLDRVALDKHTRDRLMAKVLPSVNKDGKRIVFTDTKATQMFYFDDAGFHMLQEDEFGVSTLTLLAALYAARRSIALTDIEKNSLQDQIFKFSYDKLKQVNRMEVIPNNHTYTENPLHGLRYSAPGGYYDQRAGSEEDFVRYEMLTTGKLSVLLGNDARCLPDKTFQFKEPRG